MQSEGPRPLPSVPNTQTPQDKQESLISDLLKKPIKTNLNAKFNNAKTPEKAKGSNTSKKASESKSVSSTSPKKKKLDLHSSEKKYETYSRVDLQMHEIEHELQTINFQIELKEKHKADKLALPDAESCDPSDRSLRARSRDRDLSQNSSRISIAENKGKDNPLKLTPRVYTKQFKPLLHLSVTYKDSVFSVKGTIL